MKKARTSVFYRVIRAIFKPYYYLRYHLRYVGRENVPTEGRFILASNHLQSADPIFIGTAIKRQIMFMAKAELFQKNPSKWFLSKLGAFPVDRGKNDQTSVNHFKDVLNEGYIMGIFIEGTRSKTGEFLRPKNGVSLLAHDTKTEVIPVCITNLEKSKVIHFGKPLSLADMGLSEEEVTVKQYRAASKIIMNHIKELREEDLKNYA